MTYLITFLVLNWWFVFIFYDFDFNYFKEDFRLLLKAKISDIILVLTFGSLFGFFTIFANDFDEFD